MLSGDGLGTAKSEAKQVSALLKVPNRLEKSGVNSVP